VTPDELDQKLREAYTGDRIEISGLDDSIRREIRRQSRRQINQIKQWIGVAAALVVAVGVGGHEARQRAPEPKMFGDAARDHRVEVVQRSPRRWRTTDSEVDTLTARFGLTRERVAFSGYRLTRAKICLLDGRRVLHLVYDNGGTEYSLYLTADTASVPITQATEGAEHVAGFHTSRIAGMVVGDGTASDCSRFAKVVTTAL
jgi:hypothetical protein